MHEVNIDWEAIEKELGIAGRTEKVFRRNFRGASVYVLKDSVWKVQVVDPAFEEQPHFQDLRNEHRILVFLEGTAGANKVTNFINTTTKRILRIERASGETLNNFDFDFLSYFRITAKLIKAALLLSRRGVAHGDLAPHNIMIRKDESIVLLDFGMLFKPLSYELLSIIFLFVLCPRESLFILCQAH